MTRSSTIIVLVVLTVLAMSIVQPVYATCWPWKHPTRIVVYSQIPKECGLLNKITITGRLIRADTGQGVPNAKINMYVKGIYFILPFKILNVTTDKNGFFRISWYYVPLSSGNDIKFSLKYGGNSTLCGSSTPTYIITYNPYMPSDFKLAAPNIRYSKKYIRGIKTWNYSTMNVTYVQFHSTASAASVVGANNYKDLMFVSAASMFGKCASYGSVTRILIFEPKINGYYKFNITYKYRLAYLGSIAHAFKIANTILTVVTLPEDIIGDVGIAAIKDTVNMGLKNGFVKFAKNGIKVIDKKKFIKYLAGSLSYKSTKLGLKEAIKHKIVDALNSINENIGKECINVRIYEVNQNLTGLKLIYNESKDLLPSLKEKSRYISFAVKEKEGVVTFAPKLYLNKNKLYIVNIRIDCICFSTEYFTNTCLTSVFSEGEPILTVHCVRPITPTPTSKSKHTPSLKPPEIVKVMPKHNDIYVKKGGAQSFEIKVYDPDTKYLRVTWMVDSKAIYEYTINSGDYSSINVNSADLSYGRHTVSVVVSDGMHRVSHEWNLFIVAPSQPSITKNIGCECRFVSIYYDKAIKKWIPTEVEINNHYYKFVVKSIGRNSEGSIVLIDIYKDGKEIYNGIIQCSPKFRYIGGDLYVWDVAEGITPNVYLNIAVPSATVKAKMPEVCYVSDKVTAHLVVPYSPYPENVKVSKVVNRQIFGEVKHYVRVDGRDVYVTLNAPDSPGMYKYAIYDISNKEGFLVFWTLEVRSNPVVNPTPTPTPTQVPTRTQTPTLTSTKLKVVISNPNNYDLTDYQVRIDLSRYLTSPRYLKVTDSEGSLLSFTYEQPNGECGLNPTTVIWVKVPYIPANSNTTIYVETSNTNYAVKADHVFEFYDDFKVNDLGTKWKILENYGAINISNGKLKLIEGFSDRGGQIYAVLPRSVKDMFAFEFRAMFDLSWNGRGIGIGDSEKYSLGTFTSIPNTLKVHGDMDSIRVGKYENGTGTTLYRLPISNSGIWHSYSLRVTKSGTLYVLIDGHNVATSTFLPSDYLKYIEIGNNAKIPSPGTWTNLYVDWIRVRKYADIEPTVSIEEFTSTPTVTPAPTPTPTPTAPASITLKPSATTVSPGNTFTLGVYLTANNVQGAKVCINYPSTLTYVTYKMYKAFPIEIPTPRNGTFVYTGISTTPLNLSNTKVLTLTFKANKVGTAVITGNVTFKTATGSFTIPAKPVTITVVKEPWQKYDINRGGKIGMKELITAINDWFSNKITTKELMEVINAWFESSKAFECACWRVSNNPCTGY